MQNPDIVLVAAVWLGSSVLMLPLLAFTARFGLVPLVEAVAEVRAAGRAPRAAALERRLAHLERTLAELASTTTRTPGPA
jgi:hypothetical protein